MSRRIPLLPSITGVAHRSQRHEIQPADTGRFPADGPMCGWSRTVRVAGRSGDPEASLSNALAAVTILEQMIEGGATAGAFLQALAQTLQSAPDVAEVHMEDNQDTLWVSYRSGLVHGFAVVDEGDEDQALSAPVQPAQLAAPAPPRGRSLRPPLARGATGRPSPASPKRWTPACALPTGFPRTTRR